MKNHAKILSRVSLITFLGIAVGLGVSQAQEPSVSGVYLLIEVNGEQLPADSWAKKSNGERCTEEILEGALLLDSKGQFAAFVTERVVCPRDDGSEIAVKEASTIFSGSYKRSGNQVTLHYDLFDDPDHAIWKGDILVVKSEGMLLREGQTTEFAFRRE